MAHLQVMMEVNALFIVYIFNFNMFLNKRKCLPQFVYSN